MIARTQKMARFPHFFFSQTIRACGFIVLTFICSWLVFGNESGIFTYALFLVCQSEEKWRVEIETNFLSKLTHLSENQ